MLNVMLLMALLAPATADASDIPWFNQPAAEQLVGEVEPAWLAHIQARHQSSDPGKYANRLHKALALTASRAEQPELYRAWSRTCAAEIDHIAAAGAYRAAADDAHRATLLPRLQASALEWESAIAALYATKIPLTEHKLTNLEGSLADLQANFDAYVDDRVLNITDR
ncbi:MAG: hypothetical protein ACI8S6_005885 [Myxococcota bacterium]|jgi:hypothetical protein